MPPKLAGRPSLKKPLTRTHTSSAAGNAAILIGLQFFFRALTFVGNQALVRVLSPKLLGISTQLEVYSITVLFLSREALRVAIQRQSDTTDNVSRRKDEKIPEDHVDGRTAAGRTQSIVNMAYISVALGFVFSMGLGWIKILQVDASVLWIPYFITSLSTYTIAALLELAAEPCWVVVQHKQKFEIRAKAESMATVFKCIITCGSAFWADRQGLNIGVLPFALGQLIYACMLLVVYYLYVQDMASFGHFSLWIKKIYSPDSKAFYASYFSWPLLSLSRWLFLQSCIQLLLTQGDSYLMQFLTSHTTQGIYALAANYGGLIARLLLQPIEEMSRNHFSRLLSPPSKPAILQARKNLSAILKSYILVSIPLVVVGPTVAPLLLARIAGDNWRDSGAGDVLATYCHYIPLLAINGLSEAFVSSVASETEINVQTGWMIGFFASFAGAAWLFLSVLGLGAKGIVYANSLNMALRIIWCTIFIQSYLSRYGAKLELRSLMPQPLSVAIGVGTYAVMGQLAATFTGGFVDIIKSGAVSVVFVGMLAFSERKHLFECYRDFRGQSHQPTAATPATASKEKQ